MTPLLFAAFLAVAPTPPTTAHVDCAAIPPEQPPIAQCWTPPVVVPIPPGTTTTAPHRPTIQTTTTTGPTTTLPHPVLPAHITGCVIPAPGTHRKDECTQITDASTVEVKVQLIPPVVLIRKMGRPW